MKKCKCTGPCFHGWQYDMANKVMEKTLTGGKAHARENGYHRHPIVLRNAIADALLNVSRRKRKSL